MKNIKKEIKIIIITIFILVILGVLTAIWILASDDNTVIIAGEEFSIRHTTELDVIPTSLEDGEQIARLHNLEKLRLIDAENVFATFEDGEVLLSSISGLNNLYDLELAFVPINQRALKFLRDSTQLERLDISNAWLDDISSICTLENLQELRLNDNDIIDLTPLQGLTQLEVLSLGGNENLEDISPISELINLTSLYLYFTNVSDLSPLAEMRNLKILNFSGANVYDISALANMENLIRLYAQDNDIVDLSPLSGNAELQEIWVGNNQIYTIEPLVPLGFLLLLGIEGNPVEDFSPLERHPYLEIVRDML